jgi:hypothetical protein
LYTVERGTVVLLALPFRYRYEINFARELYPTGAGTPIGLLITSPSIDGFSASIGVRIRVYRLRETGSDGLELHATATLCATLGA